jgi:L-alanine-DL-glutamate epimerase-like enolase superfamily enzyme
LEAQGGIGVGEGAPLPGLSLDGAAEWESFMTWLETKPEVELPDQGGAFRWAKEVAIRAGVVGASSILYALESAALSLLSGKPEVYFPGSYTAGGISLPINGLVWMDSLEAMYSQALEKVKAGFTTLKFKIGSHDWESEKSLLTAFRKKHSVEDITVRVDANGAYKEEGAFKVLEDLQKLDIHSIEQPIKAGQHTLMGRLVKEGATPIALDEELITQMPKDEILDMLAYVNAPFLVLKPTLVGGLAWSKELITATEKRNASWWLTSSLETTIGLTPLAQFAAQYDPMLPQGLSTGKIYTEALPNPNILEVNRLSFDPTISFDIALLKRQNPHRIDQ